MNSNIIILYNLELFLFQFLKYFLFYLLYTNIQKSSFILKNELNKDKINHLYKKLYHKNSNRIKNYINNKVFFFS